MPRDEFFRDVRRAVSFLAPRVDPSVPFTDPEYIERMLRGHDLWLAQGVVAEFRAEDFPDLDDGERQGLQQAVDDFLVVARSAAPKGATEEERQEAARPFRHIVHVVQQLVRREWLDACRRLLADAERWAAEENWPSRRYSKEVTEDFIGTYVQERLVFSPEGQQVALVPVGRFVPGTDGLFDLVVLPAYDSVMVVREGDRWFVHPLLGQNGGRKDWSKETFCESSLKLARLP